MATYGQVTTGYLPAVAIGVVLVLVLLGTTIVTGWRTRRRGRGRS